VVPDVPALRVRAYADFFVPMGTTRSSTFRTSFEGSYIGLILAQPGASLPAIQTEFYDRVRRMESPDPRVFTDLYAAAEPIFDTMARDFFNRDSQESGAGWLWAILAGVAILFMLLPTVNLVNLNVSRILERSSEIGVRRAFGASRGTLVAQFVTENVIVTGVGGAIGLLGSGLALRALNASDLIAHAALGINWRIFVWACLLAGFFGVFSGVWPAWRMSRLHPVDALRGARR
jgi:putative ABC transport system permease protein